MFVEQLRSPQFSTAHPVVRAAYAHYGLAAIHPFADGNGRVARALASAYLYATSSIPLVVYLDQREEYLQALEAADAGSFSAFVNFIFERAIATLQLVTYRMTPSPQERTATLRTLLMAQGGLSHAELDAIANELLNRLQTKLGQEAAKLRLPPGVSLGFGRGGFNAGITDGKYREPTTGFQGYINLVMSSPPPAQANVNFQFRPLIARDDRYPVALERIGSPERFEVRLSDVYPRVSADLDTQLDAWASQMLSQALDNFAAQAAQALRQAGY